MRSTRETQKVAADKSGKQQEKEDEWSGLKRETPCKPSQPPSYLTQYLTQGTLST